MVAPRGEGKRRERHRAHVGARAPARRFVLVRSGRCRDSMSRTGRPPPSRDPAGSRRGGRVGWGPHSSGLVCRCDRGRPGARGGAAGQGARSAIDVAALAIPVASVAAAEAARPALVRAGSPGAAAAALAPEVRPGPGKVGEAARPASGGVAQAVRLERQGIARAVRLASAAWTACLAGPSRPVEAAIPLWWRGNAPAGRSVWEAAPARSAERSRRGVASIRLRLEECGPRGRPASAAECGRWVRAGWTVLTAWHPAH